uniref:Uncharacterized protein n=1 Tax=Candidatus Kentrum sp. LFY TaxID=2126342 RepID=A0A450X2H6_9GAMM|nr:MAG: hypothetical protein BECKLFY1418C_GA0070996_11452 [Candidatus Kentron sp. LFY]
MRTDPGNRSLRRGRPVTWVSTVNFKPGTRAEFLAIIKYYETCQPRLGRRFRLAVESKSIVSVKCRSDFACSTHHSGVALFGNSHAPLFLFISRSASQSDQEFYKAPISLYQYRIMLCRLEAKLRQNTIRNSSSISARRKIAFDLHYSGPRCNAAYHTPPK